MVNKTKKELYEENKSLRKNLEIYRKFWETDAIEECTKQLKTLQPGHALAFGSAFKVPVEIKFEKPNPEPLSNNSDIVSAWFA